MKSNRTGNVKSKAGKNAAVLAFSLALGGVGVYYSKSYIEEQVNYYRSQLNKTEEMGIVIVPKRRLVRGERVLAGDLSTREMPTKFIDSNSVSGANYKIAIGQRISYDVDPGRPLLWAHLEGGLSPTFSGKVPNGLRAVTIEVDEVNSFSGFLQPKDRVDFLLTHGSADNATTFPLLQNLEVMATGVRTAVDKTGHGGPRRFTTVTVKVSDEEAKKVTLAKQVGKITAMLRNPDDEAPLLERAMTVAQLLNRPVPPPPVKRVIRKKRSKPAIEFIIGGSGSQK